MRERLRQLGKFLSEVRSELGRTTWPSWTEVRGTTVVVIVTSLIFSAFLFVVDYGLSRAIDYLFEVLVH